MSQCVTGLEVSYKPEFTRVNMLTPSMLIVESALCLWCGKYVVRYHITRREAREAGVTSEYSTNPRVSNSPEVFLTISGFITAVVAQDAKRKLLTMVC